MLSIALYSLSSLLVSPHLMATPCLLICLPRYLINCHWGVRVEQLKALYKSKFIATASSTSSATASSTSWPLPLVPEKLAAWGVEACTRVQSTKSVAVYTQQSSAWIRGVHASTAHWIPSWEGKVAIFFIDLCWISEGRKWCFITFASNKILNREASILNRYFVEKTRHLLLRTWSYQPRAKHPRTVTLFADRTLAPRRRMVHNQASETHESTK